MNKGEQSKAVQLLHEARGTIQGLRERINQLEPKANAYDTIEQIARLSQRAGGGYAEVDLNWKIGEFFAEIDENKPEAFPGA